ncbi:hypothetical protein [Microbacterium soli]|uniref:ScoMcrA-like N-terminal head domain-containing protein n=1 Tax=Microbacterium soli TaxID=446075 RepID=A0ABP7N266_9MICO
MVSYTALTDRSAVDAAIDECDRVGRAAFLHKYGFREASTYFLITEDGCYDSKAIFGVAYGIQHGTPLGSDEFSGGKDAAAGRLSELGYTIEGMDSARTYFDSLDAALDDFRHPVENRTRVRAFAMERDFERFYTTPSRTYIAMIERGAERPSAWAHVGFISYRKDDGTLDEVTLPYNRVRGGGASRQRSRTDAERATCPNPDCGMQLPASGTCDYC